MEHSLGAKHADVRPRDPGIATAMQRHHHARCQPTHDHTLNIDIVAAVIQPRADLNKLLTRQIDDGVEHVCAGIEQEAATSDLWHLPPGVGRAAGPPLPGLLQPMVRDFAQVAPRAAS